MAVDGVVSFLAAHPNWGWVLVLAAGVEQLYAPWNTRTKQLVGRIENQIHTIEQMQKAQMTVIRALARVHEDILTEKVDDYLVENGAEPDDFVIRKRADGGDDAQD